MRWILAVAALVAALAGCTLSEPLAGSEDRPAASEIGGWTVQISVTPANVRRLAVSVGRAREARRAPGPWVEHDLVFENHGRRTLELAGSRSAAAFIGPAGHRRRLLASAGLCWYATEGRGSRLTRACLAMLDVVTLEPGASRTGTVTLTRGLRGMEPFVAGTYVFEVPVGLRATAAGPGREAILRIVYRIHDASATAA